MGDMTPDIKTFLTVGLETMFFFYIENLVLLRKHNQRVSPFRFSFLFFSFFFLNLPHVRDRSNAYHSWNLTNHLCDIRREQRGGISEETRYDRCLRNAFLFSFYDTMRQIYLTVRPTPRIDPCLFRMGLRNAIKWTLAHTHTHGA